MPQRILLVDDDKQVREMLTALLAENGYAVSEAKNGRVAMEEMLRQPANLVITDMVMPEMDGVETMVALRRSHPEVKVIAISENRLGPAENFLKIASKLGARKTFAKPLDPQQLLTAVRELLG
jgi:DNA-binding response OmpR family regulator